MLASEHTVVDEVRNTTTRLAIDVANILLQAGVGDAAATVGDGTVGVLARVDDTSRGAGESNGKSDDGELHFES